MPRYVALLRGINIGGRSRLAMADLRQVAEGLGYDAVSTYIQSGNLLFTAPRRAGAALAADLAAAIAARLPVRPGVVVVAAAELDKVIAHCPFDPGPDPRMVHAVFRNDDMPAAGREAVAQANEAAKAAGSPHEAAVVGRTLYLSTPGGFGTSRLAARLGSSAAMQGGTARNWATVTKLASLLAEPAG